MHYDWEDNSGRNFDVELGLDFGWGGAVDWNGEWVYITKSNVWWGGSDWNNGAVWRIHDLVTRYGNNNLDVWGSEGCFDGAFNIRYRFDDAAW